MTEEEITLQEELTLQEAADAATDTPSQDRPQKLTALLKDLMAQRSITPTQLANDLGLNPSNVTGFLQGKKNPTLSTIDRIALALHVPAWMLLNTPEEVISDLQALGLLPEPQEPQAPASDAAPADGSVPSNSVASEDDAAAKERIETPQDGRKFDLCTIDPQTGETRLYRLVNP